MLLCQLKMSFFTDDEENSVEKVGENIREWVEEGIELRSSHNS